MMSTRSARCLLGALAIAIATNATAQPKPPPRPSPPPAPAPPPPAPPPRPRSALAAVAEAIAKDLEKAPTRALVASAPLTTDTPAPRAAELTAAIAAQVAGRRGAATRSRAEPTALASARDAAKGDAALIHLVAAIAAGHLRVTADVYPVPKSVWSKIRDPEPGPVLHAFVDVPIDAEIRSFLAPIPLVAAHVDRAKNFESDAVAIACGDIDQDGALEIASVSRRRVTTLRLREGRVQILTSRNWPDLAPVAPAPLREAIAFATVVRRAGGAWLDVGTTDRAKSVRLDVDLKPIATFGGIAVPDGDGTACAHPGSLVVTGILIACTPGDPAPFAASVGGRYDAFASAPMLSPRGEPSVVWAGREDRVLELRDDKGHHLNVEGAGAQIAVADLDQDGDPEIITSLDTLNPLEDAVVVRTWLRDAKGPPAKALRDMMRIPAAAGVHAIGACPPDASTGRTPFVVATADEIWVVR